jgi:hypothetical protein
MPVSSCTTSCSARVCAALFAIACATVAGCGETTQTVGRLKASTSAHSPQSGLPASTNQPIGGARSDAGAAGTTNATTSMPGGSDGSGQGQAGVTGLLGPAAPPPGVACAATSTMPATLRQVDLYLMVDTNISIPLSGAWDNVRNGLSRYVDDRCAAGVGVGVRYFGVDCTAMTYATPTTPVALLPKNADAIKQQIPSKPFMASPTLPALQGALTYAQSRANAYPDSKQVVVLLSDGFFDWICQGPNLVQSVFTGTSTGTTVTRPTGTTAYVVALDAPNLAGVAGLAQLLDPVIRFQPLDSIAQAGGTAKARHIDLQASATVFAHTLVDIQHDAQPCDYAVPDEVRADPSAMTIGLRDANGAQTALPLVTDASACGNGGYYLENPASPSWAMLCPATCSAVKTRCDEVVWVTGC